MNFKHITCFSLLGLGAASAHLGALTSPKGGESFKAGDKVTINWSVDTPHNGIDLALSTDGSTWTTFTTASLGRTIKTFSWTVPNTPSTTARIRICQRDGASVSGCTDAHNTTHATDGIAVAGGEVYTLISPNFTITGSSAVLPALSGAAAFIRSEGAGLEVSFALDKREQVRLTAYDLRGQVVASLLDESRDAGSHRLSLFSHALSPARAVVLRLMAGDRVLAEARAGGR